MSKVTLTRFLAVIVQMEIGWTMEHSQCKIRKIMTKKKKRQLVSTEIPKWTKLCYTIKVPGINIYP